MLYACAALAANHFFITLLKCFKANPNKHEHFPPHSWNTLSPATTTMCAASRCTGEPHGSPVHRLQKRWQHMIMHLLLLLLLLLLKLLLLLLLLTSSSTGAEAAFVTAGSGEPAVTVSPFTETGRTGLKQRKTYTAYYHYSRGSCLVHLVVPLFHECGSAALAVRPWISTNENPDFYV